jgi:hypothetical protein
LNERTLCVTWNNLLFHHEGLSDVEGRPLQLVYRGRWQGGPGPDFRGAIIALGDGRLLHGDVELHLASADWQCHHHERDPLYDNVVLHVVLRYDRAAPAVRHDGSRVPTLCLGDYLYRQWRDEELPALERWEPEPCRSTLVDWSDEQVGRLLDEAGDQRFRERIAACEGDIAALGVNETVYRRLLDALGYAQNRVPMRELACRLPYATLADFLRPQPPAARSTLLARLLYWTAGLAPEEPVTATARQAWPVEPLPPGRWRVNGLRPANSPWRRLAAAASILADTLDTGLATALCFDLPSVPPRALSRELRRRLQVVEPDQATPGRRLIGPGRAGEIVVNVLLPCAAAFADLADRPALAGSAWSAYRAHPNLGNNEITRQMARLLLGQFRRGLAKGARRQQGLLHLFRRYCDLQRCTDCPAGAKAD